MSLCFWLAFKALNTFIIKSVINTTSPMQTCKFTWRLLKNARLKNSGYMFPLSTFKFSFIHQKCTDFHLRDLITSQSQLFISNTGGTEKKTLIQTFKKLACQSANPLCKQYTWQVQGDRHWCLWTIPSSSHYCSEAHSLSP